jgi:hypothetical protein
MLLLGACLLQTLYAYGQTRAVASLVTATVVLVTGTTHIRSASLWCVIHSSEATQFSASGTWIGALASGSR